MILQPRPLHASAFGLVLSLLLLPALVHGHQGIQRAETALKQGKSQKALEGYKEALADGYDGAGLQYNIGSLAFKKGDLGRAIFHLEKAKQLAPFNDNINANLQTVRAARADADIGPNQQASWWELSARAFLWFHGVIVWLIVLALGWLLLLLRVSLSGGPFRIRAGLLVAWGLLGFVFTSVLSYRLSLDEKTFASLMVKESHGKSAPADSAENAFTAHEGAYGEILEAQNGFLRLRLHNGLEAWFEEKNLYLGSDKAVK